MDKKAAQAIDKHVGSRVRMRRMMLGLSQEKLGDRLGVTFQQVQKNEKGSNRIGASRLHQLAQILQVPVSFFFEGLPGAKVTEGLTASDLIGAFFTLPGANELAQNYVAIERHASRRVVIDVAGEIASMRQAAE